MRLDSGRFGVRWILSGALAVCVALGAVPALAAAPQVSGLNSPSHPDEGTWYADDSPEFAWDAASGSPTLLGSCDTPDMAIRVAVSNGYAYVADATSGLQVVDVSDPTSPTVAASYDTTGTTQGVVVVGDTAYLADGQALRILDVSDPSAPVLAGSLELPYGAKDLAVESGIAYVAAGHGGLLVVDVSDATTPTLLGTYDTPDFAWSVAVAGDVALVTDFSDLLLVDISDPSAPALLATYDAQVAREVVVAGDTAYLADGTKGLVAIDVTDPTAPVLLDEIVFVPGAKCVNLSGSIVYVSDGSDTASAVHAIDVTDPSNLVSLGSWTSPDFPCGLASADGIVYVTGYESGLHVVDFGVGPMSYSYELDQDPTTVPDTIAESLETTAGFTTVADGAWYFHVRPVTEGGLAGATEHLRVRIGSGPQVSSLEGPNRYATAVAVTTAAFPLGITETVEGKKTVVVATGANWPDALGGASLAGAYGGPILLTAPTALPSEIASEVVRLGATRVAVLGSEKAVSESVRAALDALPGVETTRIAGADRYATARAVAAETVRVLELSGTYDGTAFVATGANFPDALAASPLAAANGWPLYLAKPTGVDATTLGAMEHEGVTDVLVLGSDKAVSAATYSRLDAAFDVERLEGVNRYATARRIAEHGVASAGLSWRCVAIATGQNFPDALSGGVLQGSDGGVLLLTPSTVIAPECEAALSENKDAIDEVRYLGSEKAIASAVRTKVQSIIN